MNLKFFLINRLLFECLFCAAANLEDGDRRDRSTGEASISDFPFPYPFPFSSISPSASALFDSPFQTSSGLPSSTFVMTDRSCWTLDGKLGTCGSVRSCYPNFKLPELSNLETWVLGIRGTCNYVESDGRQVITQRLNVLWLEWFGRLLERCTTNHDRVTVVQPNKNGFTTNLLQY